MHRMLQLDHAADVVIATGETNSLEDFVAEVFSALDLDWRDHVEHDPALRRPSEIRANHASTARAQATLGWSAKLRMSDVVRKLVACELAGAVE
jgi:GDPmannose 4,6-dehydratase